MKTNPFTKLTVERAVPCTPKKRAHQRRGAHRVPRRAFFALLAAAALITRSAFGAKPPPPPPPPPSSGALVLNFLYPGGDFANNWGLTVAPSGTIYASGIANGGTMHGLVLASSDSGSSWSLLDDFAPAGRSVWYENFGGGIAWDTAGNLYVAGAMYDFVNYIEPDQWYVRRSTDGGGSWANVDIFDIPGQQGGLNSSDVTAIVADTAGDVYVSGSIAYKNWTLRKGVGGASFYTVDAMTGSCPLGLFAHPIAGVFAIGSKTVNIKGKNSNVWLVRRSTNGGAAWLDVDAFQLSVGNGATANGIGSDAVGNLYVVGRGATTIRGNTVYHWLVRRSTDGGNSWSTVDDFVQGSNSAEARRFVATSNGDLYVAGIATASTGTHWIVRKNPGGTGPWTTIDDYQYATGKATEPHAMTADAAGNLLVGGGGWDTSGTRYLWLIKKY